MKSGKYRPYPKLELASRQWPSNCITKAPVWCSVDLRDGNQALIDPMTLDEKIRLFELLVKIGFKEIEVGFPSASQVEFDFTRYLIEENRIPKDVTIQVLTQAREHLIRRSYEAIKGCAQAIVHVYNSTSEAQRRLVFGKNKEEIKALAVDGARLLLEGAKDFPEGTIRFEYSPESFTATEIEYALEVCDAVLDVWKPSPSLPAIINLPATVELSTPNIYADRIEWVHKRLSYREGVILSVHTHNDRGTGVAASELALMAGAQRVEGTLFGNGERTGNCDLVTVALNLFSQGVDPKLDFSHIEALREVCEEVTKLPIHPRHPYVGDLVFTAFSGSHQDAISKGMAAYQANPSPLWEVPYLPIDPTDLGRTYQNIIRINSQSGKGGVAYILEREFGLQLPKNMHAEFGRIIQKVTDSEGTEITPERVYTEFEREYLAPTQPFRFAKLWECTTHEHSRIVASVNFHGEEQQVIGTGLGLLEAFANSIAPLVPFSFRLLSMDQHSVTKHTRIQSAAYVQVEPGRGNASFGVGLDPNHDVAAMKALLSALNRIANAPFNP